jgi:hypothetical protein
VYFKERPIHVHIFVRFHSKQTFNLNVGGCANKRISFSFGFWTLLRSWKERERERERERDRERKRKRERGQFYFCLSTLNGYIEREVSFIFVCQLWMGTLWTGLTLSRLPFKIWSKKVYSRKNVFRTFQFILILSDSLCYLYDRNSMHKQIRMNYLKKTFFLYSLSKTYHNITCTIIFANQWYNISICKPTFWKTSWNT